MGVAAAAIAVVGAGVSAYGASQAGKGGSAPRNAGNELGSLPYKEQLKAIRGLNKEQLKSDREYANLLLQLSPKFAAQDVENRKLAAAGALSLYPEYAGAERAMTTRTRGADAADLAAYGDDYSSAFAANSPGFAAVAGEVERGRTSTPLMGRLNYEALTAGRSPIGGELESQALDDLRLGRELSPDELRAATQSARGAFASRGLAFSNAGIGAEILNRDSYATDRQDRRRGFASGVMGLIGNEDEANRRLMLNTEGLNNSEEQGWRQFLLNAEGITSRPLYSMLSTRAPESGMSGALGGMGLGMSTSQAAQSLAGAPSVYQGAAALTPLYNYGADVFNTNFNAGESRQIRQANAYTSIGSGMMGMGSGVARGSMSGAGTGF